MPIDSAPPQRLPMQQMPQPAMPAPMQQFPQGPMQRQPMQDFQANRGGLPLGGGPMQPWPGGVRR
jgi:hypothetical protein